MRSAIAAVVLTVVLGLSIGCEPAPNPVANPPQTVSTPLAPPPPPTTQPPIVPAAPSSPASPTTNPPPLAQPASPAPFASPAAPVQPEPAASLGTAAFEAAHSNVGLIEDDIRSLLQSVNDNASAEQAAAKLPALTEQWRASTNAATALYVALSSNDQRSWAAGQMTQENLQAARDKQPVLVLMLELAHGPHRSVLEPAIVGFRDAALEKTTIYSNKAAQKKTAEKLGDLGAPLK